ncbi:MAG: thioesterase family protein [Bdellovibrionales bacterium]|nr:thioesterase family protein [Bdellovibrionales bacterium]NQZ20016.1 thioesterase family protein [Bdellovibrionales bacterium]
MSFESRIQIHFDDADPAGIAFFGGIFAKIHQCYEDFLKHIKVDLEKWFLNPDIIAPIRHCEAEYFRPLKPFNEYAVMVKALKVSESSFQLQFSVQKDGNDHVIVKTTHVCVDPKVMKKTEIPSDLKLQLEKFL